MAKKLTDVVGVEFVKGQLVSYPVQTPKGIVVSVAEVTHVGREAIHLVREREDGKEYHFISHRPDRLTVTQRNV